MAVAFHLQLSINRLPSSLIYCLFKNIYKINIYICIFVFNMLRYISHIFIFFTNFLKFSALTHTHTHTQWQQHFPVWVFDCFNNLNGDCSRSDLSLLILVCFHIHFFVFFFFFSILLLLLLLPLHFPRVPALPAA